jgi:hypothetical protein
MFLLRACFRYAAGPGKDRFISYFIPYPAMPLCNLLEGSLLVRSFLPYPFLLSGPFPLAFPSQTPYKPSTFQLYHFSPEYRDSMFRQMLVLTYETARRQNPRQQQLRFIILLCFILYSSLLPNVADSTVALAILILNRPQLYFYSLIASL